MTEPDELNNAAGVLLRDGSLAEAAKLLLTAIAIAPHRADLRSNLGYVYWKLERLAEGERACREAVELEPNYMPGQHNLGLVLADEGRFDEAETAFRTALAIDPQALTHINLGLALESMKRVEEAAGEYQAALTLEGDNVDAMHNLAVAQHRLGDLRAAVSLYRRALKVAPNNPALHNNLGRALVAAGSSGEAIAAYGKAISLSPDYADALNNLGNALRDLGQPGRALPLFRRVLELDPGFAGIHNNIALALDELGQPQEALRHYREALKSSSGQPAIVANAIRPLAQICAWTEVDALAARLRDLVSADPTAPTSPYLWLTIPSTPEEQLRAANVWVSHRYGEIESVRNELGFRFGRRKEGRLRVGYISADFRNHAVGRLMVDLVETHDQDRVEVTGYSIGPDDGSELRKRFLKGFATFVDCFAWPSVAIARRIHADAIDILIDLTGHTQGARTDVMALRPAPVQVSFLGYPGTMGAPFIDYVITDRFLTPAAQQAHFNERFAYLDGCYQPNALRPAARRTPRRDEVGLAEDKFVFCCFNNPYKLRPEVWEIWMDLLGATSSLLWLFADSDDVIVALRRAAVKRDVDPARLVFTGRRPYADYLALYRLADLFLDTYPYNAGATAADALLMGLPVLTRAGQTYVSRMAGSLLTGAGLPQLITTSLPEYRETAVRLATNQSAHAALKATVESVSGSSFFDIRQYAERFETLLERLSSRP